MKNKNILIVEDQLIIAKVYSVLLSKKGYNVTVAKNANDAILRNSEINPCLILMDIQLDEQLSGIDVARQLRINGSDCPIIFTTGNLFEKTKEEVADIENCDVLIKPVDFSEIEKFL